MAPRLAIYLGIIASAAGILAIGFALNSPFIGAVSGYVLGTCVDPVAIVLGLAAGWAASRGWDVFLYAIAAAVLYVAAVSLFQMGMPFGDTRPVALRLLFSYFAVLLWGAVGGIASHFVRKDKPTNLA